MDWIVLHLHSGRSAHGWGPVLIDGGNVVIYRMPTIGGRRTYGRRVTAVDVDVVEIRAEDRPKRRVTVEELRAEQGVSCRATTG